VKKSARILVSIAACLSAALAFASCGSMPSAVKVSAAGAAPAAAEAAKRDAADEESPGEVPAPVLVPAPADSASGGLRGDSDAKDGFFTEAELDGKGALGEEGSLKMAKEAPGKPSSASPRRTSAKAESGLKAGYSDDNEQFNYYLKFLDDYGRGIDQYPLRVGERIVITVTDGEGKPVNGAAVTASANGKRLTSGRTYASGTFSLYPLEYADAGAYDVVVSQGSEKASARVERGGPRTVRIALKGKRVLPQKTPLDILFVIDTTGSMSEEIQRLKDTIEIISANVASVSPAPLVRFGMVLYRDKGDAYVTKVAPLTESLEEFQEALDWVEADGGGDGPEDLQSALSDAVKKIQWNRDGIRLAFVITDAEAHLDYGQSYTYAEAARDAKAMGVKIHTIGTGSLPLGGEYVLRQVAQYTQGRYIFLTYGEKGESEGGREASVSHHTGSNYQTDKLEAIVIRFAREELAFQSDVPVQAADDWFEAKKISGEERDDTLGKLFGQALRNLADYSSIRVGAGTKAAIAPIGFLEADKAALAGQAEYFSESLLLSASAGKAFTLVERKDLQKILAEQELQYSALADEKTAAKLGSLIGAEIRVTGQLYAKRDAFEVFLKLVRVETGEVLAVTKAKIAKELGL